MPVAVPVVIVVLVCVVGAYSVANGDCSGAVIEMTEASVTVGVNVVPVPEMADVVTFPEAVKDGTNWLLATCTVVLDTMT